MLHHPDPNTYASGRFSSTHWSLIIQGGIARIGAGPHSPGRTLPPLLVSHPRASIRRKGNGHDQALDLTQESFARLLEKGIFAAAEPGKHGPVRPVDFQQAWPALRPRLRRCGLSQEAEGGRGEDCGGQHTRQDEPPDLNGRGPHSILRCHSQISHPLWDSRGPCRHPGAHIDEHDLASPGGHLIDGTDVSLLDDRGPFAPEPPAAGASSTRSGGRMSSSPADARAGGSPLRRARRQYRWTLRRQTSARSRGGAFRYPLRTLGTATAR